MFFLVLLDKITELRIDERLHAISTTIHYVFYSQKFFTESVMKPFLDAVLVWYSLLESIVLDKIRIQKLCLLDSILTIK